MLNAGEISTLRDAVKERSRPRTHYGQCWLASDHRDCAITQLLATVEHLRKGIKLARAEWLKENDPKDGTDCVTPYDEYLY